MRSLLVGAVLSGLCLVSGALGAAAAQPWSGPDGGGAVTPVADYPDPRPLYDDDPPPPFRPYAPGPESYEGPPRSYGPPMRGRYEPDEPEPRYRDYRGAVPEAEDGYGPPRPTRRCWIRQGYDGPERVCRP
ncbi:hypothetical protein [uncultured Enterovirga sp.]|uniref:hypothetical protein n=1 Tax=uncultured Enterovirga sp. TaxID=2026352 RepID=UPI0035CC679F